jgi:hypothetical protein
VSKPSLSLQQGPRSLSRGSGPGRLCDSIWPTKRGSDGHGLLAGDDTLSLLSHLPNHGSIVVVRRAIARAVFGAWISNPEDFSAFATVGAI